MDGRAGLHIRSLDREVADDILRRMTCMHRFFKVGKSLDIKDRGDVREEEIIEPVCLVGIQGLEGRLVEYKNRPLRHKGMIPAADASKLPGG